MNDNPLEVLRQVGSIHNYTDKESISAAVDKIEHAIAQVRDRYESLPNQSLRSVYALDVLQELLETARQRAAGKEKPGNGVNDDVFYIMGQWIEYVRDTTMAREVMEQEQAEETARDRFVCEN